MGKITSITRQVKNKSRVSIFVDCEYFGALDEKTFLESGLKSGDEINEDQWNILFEKAEQQSAFNKGITYISRQMRSEKQIRDYLLKKEYNDISLEFAINLMKEYKYIDDTAYAKMILSHQANVKKAGFFAAKNAMYKSGISNDIIDKTLAEYDNEAQLENAKETYKKLVKKYMRETDETKKKQKISQAMARKGYDWEMIKKVLNFSKELL